jgi:hypothetical protein
MQNTGVNFEVAPRGHTWVYPAAGYRGGSRYLYFGWWKGTWERRSIRLDSETGEVRVDGKVISPKFAQLNHRVRFGGGRMIRRKTISI